MNDKQLEERIKEIISNLLLASGREFIERCAIHQCGCVIQPETPIPEVYLKAFGEADE
jgi:hypothetical protein